MQEHQQFVGEALMPILGEYPEGLIADMATAYQGQIDPAIVKRFEGRVLDNPMTYKELFAIRADCYHIVRRTPPRHQNVFVPETFIEAIRLLADLLIAYERLSIVDIFRVSREVAVDRSFQRYGHPYAYLSGVHIDEIVLPGSGTCILGSSE